ncbi:MAG: SDR family oxidoreductase [Cyanosarcina radialis HA8281-LM2]|nr:SDR family oxidoreductase [Cyanosarcina radialis HA8281-LM2]
MLITLCTGEPAELYESVRAANPQGRWGQPEDAARLIAWLATDDTQWVTGQAIDSTLLEATIQNLEAINSFGKHD